MLGALSKIGAMKHVRRLVQGRCNEACQAPGPIVDAMEHVRRLVKRRCPTLGRHVYLLFLLLLLE